MRWAISVLLLVMLNAVPAQASPTYPDALAAQLDLSCAPACTLCHETMAGGAATANTRFGIEVRARRGLVSGNTEKLIQVISQLETDGTDSDGDGQSDVAELRAGTNPNGSEPLGCAPPPAEDEGGCGVARGTGGSGLPALSGLLIAVMMLRRRARVSSV